MRDSGIARVIAGTLDANAGSTGGAATLRAAGVDVIVLEDERARALAEPFGIAMTYRRPYVALKMATSADGFVTSAPQTAQWLTGPEARQFVRELRIAHDAVMVGAGTVRIDDPRLTVRPPHHRARPYVRVVACGSTPPENTRRMFAAEEGYARSVALVPAGMSDRFSTLEDACDVAPVGDPDDDVLDLRQALRALSDRDIASVLCEGGPKLASRLVAEGLVDRFYWLVAPTVLNGDAAVSALPLGNGIPPYRYDAVERLGSDVMFTGVFERV